LKTYTISDLEMQNTKGTLEPYLWEDEKTKTIQFHLGFVFLIGNPISSPESSELRYIVDAVTGEVTGP
jgi:hypothetical protein